ncbi:Hypothetical predicted protein [Olea europaea subsp. europaea]|uniref:Uncharacterized protein n=1 Tax=Olea europaea subsp. europaea TaxID=158383 RepID=A0A8S0S143_OLEEU|nr:Hypothetical predicted protein [Olea europaea subsp. europaea]
MDALLLNLQLHRFFTKEMILYLFQISPRSVDKCKTKWKVRQHVLLKNLSTIHDYESMTCSVFQLVVNTVL